VLDRALEQLVGSQAFLRLSLPEFVAINALLGQDGVIGEIALLAQASHVAYAVRRAPYSRRYQPTSFLRARLGSGRFASPRSTRPTARGNSTLTSLNAALRTARKAVFAVDE